jgi:competence protein ComEA
MAGHGKLNVNEASKDELTHIPGLGDSTAQAIIDYRASHGWIDDLGELEDDERINPHDIDRLRDWLTTGPEEEQEEEELW